jgi:HEAT repeat protein
LRQIYESVISFLLTAFLALALTFDSRGYCATFLFQSQTDQQSSQSEVTRFRAQLGSADEEERRHAALMLMAIGTAEAAQALGTASNDLSPRVRALVMTGLATLGDKSSVPIIADRLRQDKTPFVRKAAAYALGRLQSIEATAALSAALKDKEIEVRGAAAVALGQYQDASAVPALIAALSDKQEFVRAQAARALGVNARASIQAVPTLVKLLTSDKEQEVKRQAATALGLIGDRSALPALEQAQHSSDPYLSQAAIEALNRIQGLEKGERE